ncbi:MAG: hypothetical protein K1X72_25690 [Pyrinomonadaceae bacterium]|nr:hypothetical protein [Pyrinomonadaceae bacterium]
MIRPVKYLDLNSCVLNVASFVISELNQSGTTNLRELSEIVTTRLGENARFSFFPALSFLFLLGKVDYNENADAIIPTFLTN